MFQLVSGAKLNKENTFGMWLGRWRGRLDQPAGLHWTSEYSKLYCVYLGNEASNRLGKKSLQNLKNVSIYTAEGSYRLEEEAPF